jgi:hypothetical protein
LLFKDFVVIVELRLTAADEVRGKFVTAFLAGNSLGSITRGPFWDRGEWLRLEKNGKDGR